MKLLPRLVLLAFIGGVATVLVGWGCTIRWVVTTPGGQATDGRAGSWPRGTPLYEVVWIAAGGGVWRVQSRRSCGGERPLPSFYFEVVGHPPVEDWLPTWAHPRAPRPDGYAPCDRLVEERASGWPWPALRSTRSRTGRGWEMHPGVDGGIPIDWLDRSRQGAVALPAMPLWPGFVLDATFYAAALALAAFMMRTAHRTIRRRLGRCPRCGFHLLDDSRGCSECGWGRAATRDQPASSM